LRGNIGANDLLIATEASIRFYEGDSVLHYYLKWHNIHANQEYRMALYSIGLHHVRTLQRWWRSIRQKRECLLAFMLSSPVAVLSEDLLKHCCLMSKAKQC
jgi:hypothetical protein